MTLTTERLKALLDELKSWQYGYDPVDDKEQFDMLATAEWAVIELLANREAQPFGYVYTSKDGVAVNFGHELPFMPEKWNVTPVYTAPPAPAYPERLPCPVHLLPGLKFGKGVPTRSMLDALVRRAEYESELEAMTPEQRAENDARLEKLKALIPQPSLPGIITASMAAEKAFRLGAVLNSAEAEQFAEGWNACRAAMLDEPQGI
ncbi:MULTISPECIES: hypothetical protein [Serratia]|uniref:hypothetical protein n=1 Tax=Serratia TaxID=613 RepID=UPI00313B7D17